MGDAILATPALKRLRSALPNARITCLGNQTVCDILEHLPGTDQLLSCPQKYAAAWKMLAAAKWLRTFQFDAVILLPNSFRTALLARLAGIKQRVGYNRDRRGFLLTASLTPLRIGKSFAPISMLDYYHRLIDRAIEYFGRSAESKSPDPNNQLELFTGPDDQRQADRLLEHWKISHTDRYAILVPGGAFGSSKWWPTENFAQLAARLHHQGFKVILLCAPNETEKRIACDITAKSDVPLYTLHDQNLSLGTIKELIKRAALVVANDTGPCHIAAAFGVPLVTPFGPTDPRWTHTGYDREIRLRVNVDCGPCQKPICATDHRCLERITVDQVAAAARHLMAKSPDISQFSLSPSYVPLRRTDDPHARPQWPGPGGLARHPQKKPPRLFRRRLHRSR